jgi:thymidylate synthase (FAD)
MTLRQGERRKERVMDMNVKLIAHTQLAMDFMGKLNDTTAEGYLSEKMTDGQAVALTAIRTCYSHLLPSDILNSEYEKYFEKQATDGKGGTEADRLIRHIVNSGHLSTMEHLSFTFAIEGVSRSLLAQLTRHRIGFSYSVQSQRYTKFGSNDRSGGAGYVIPHTIEDSPEALSIYSNFTEEMQRAYDNLRKLGIPAEDARYVLSNGATCNLVMSANLRALFDFYGKRNENTHAQWEIKQLAEQLREEVTKVENWLEPFFEKLKGGN